MDRRKRIGLYGGTFDPIHLGHLEVARQVSRLFEIDELWFVLAQLAPHKQSRTVTSSLHRYGMLALATQDEERFLISTYELDVPGRCYTVDTLAYFRSLWSDTADLFFVMGGDSWAEITTWRDYVRLLGLTNHVVVTRPGYEIATVGIGNDLSQRMIDMRGLRGEDARSAIQVQDGPMIFVTDVAMIDISATDIRKAIKEADNSLAQLVPSAVADYVRKYQLYREKHEREFTD